MHKRERGIYLCVVVFKNLIRDLLANKQLVKNTGWSFLELGLYPLLMIVATPIFISKLGVEQYGVWMLLNTFLQALNACNLGIGDATIRLVSHHRAIQQMEQVKKIVHTHFFVAILLAIFIMFLAALLAGLNVFSFFSISEAFYQNSKILLMLGCASGGFKFLELVVLGVFKGFERFDHASKLSLLSRNSVVIATIAVCYFAPTLNAVFIITLLLNVVNFFAQLLALIKFLPGIRFMMKPEISSFLSEWRHFHFWYWLQSTMSLFGYLIDKFLVAILFDMVTLGYYSIGSLIASQIHNVLLSLSAFVFPRISFKMALGNVTDRVFRVSSFAITMLGWSILLFLFITGKYIFTWWLGSEVYQSSSVFINYFLLFESVSILTIVPYQYYNATPFVKYNSLNVFILRTTNLMGILMGYYFGGASGMILGLILTTWMNIPFQDYFFYKNVFSKNDIKSAFLFLLPLIPFSVLAFTDSYLVQLFATGVFIVLYYYTYLKRIL